MKKKEVGIYNKKNGIPDKVIYAYMTKRDILNFDSNYNKCETKKRYPYRHKLIPQGKPINDEMFNNLEAKGFPGLELKSTTKIRRLNEVKNILYEAMKDEIFETIAKNDEVVDLYYGQCFLHAGKKVRNSKNYSNIKYYSNKIFFLITHFFPHNVKYLVSLKRKTKYIKLLNEYKNKVTYEPKHFVYRPL